MEERIEYFLDEALAGRKKKAQSGIAELMETHPENAGVYFAQGVLEVHEANHEAALDAFDRAVELDPKMDEAWMNKASAHRCLGQSNEMVLSLRQVCALTPPDDELHLKAKDSLDAFEETMQETEGLSTDAFLAAEELFKEAREHAENKEYEEAISIILENPDRIPENERTLTLLGACYRALEQWDTARDYLEKALEIDPEHFTARINLMLLRSQEPGGDGISSLVESLQKIQKDIRDEGAGSS